MPDVAADTAGLSVMFHRKSERWVVPSRDLARKTAHRHHNIMRAARVAAQELADAGYPDALITGQYISRKHNRVHACAHITREVLRRMRLHNVAGCRTVPAILAEYLRMLDGNEPGPEPGAPTMPAADSEIRPPEQEPPGLFEPVDAGPDAAASWEINAAVLLLSKRGGLPRYIADDLNGWNAARCDALRERAKSWDEVGRIYDTRGPG